MEQRIRKQRGTPTQPSDRLPEFLNPYPWMSQPEAMVHLELERRRVPFSWRYFDGVAPTLKQLVPNFHPEFTLREYKLVITVQGGFFGSQPEVLSRLALAQVALKEDGWKVVILFEHEIRNRLHETLDKMAPELIRPTITGPQRPSPFSVPNTMETRRWFLRGLALLKAHFTPEKVNVRTSRERKFVRRRNTDSGRYRPLSRRYRKSGA